MTYFAGRNNDPADCDAHDLRIASALGAGNGNEPDAPELKAETFEIRIKGDQIQVRVGAIR